MNAIGQASLPATLQTCIALCQRFAASLSPDAPFEVPRTQPTAPSPLVLLHAAVTTLRAQVTKLSLLAITAPFTASAVTTCLAPLNESILTSLVTAALLATPELFTPSFSAECRNLAAVTFRDLKTLLELLEVRSRDSSLTVSLQDSAKKPFTEATGKIWDDCDNLIPLASEGVHGFVTKRAKQWLDLMKDAVEELEEWDPEDDVVDDDLLGGAHSDDDASDDTGDKDRAAISAGVKEQALKVLSRIPQSVHVVIKQRLEKFPAGQGNAAPYAAQLDTLLMRTRHISELIDESAEAMYLGDLELCLKKAGEARAVTIDIVESVTDPFVQAHDETASRLGTKEDKYIQRALEWIRQVDTGAHPRGPSLSQLD
ncbi:hypothetical protein A1O7_05628 [Cladophialophora yegresii CBS 114405]|uniref:Cyclin-D1-binding protein 1-like N-terminal domain-containing protein n=1 Tax=Cladophialophora yegresii CBS 114405 TaxID=1182544 RepID=W9VRL4_9EURO|nr:uncharacterized protein A1O7_05628 [Cladophialophora yegresii CBS 114405]EXJ58203.1 hypothetical protein A1O7_05628 [Cladophialophora yegresii CBS 114405]